MKKLLPVLAFAALFAASCDKVDGPPYSENPTGSNDTGAVRRVLIEDYTGAKCGNCPRAAETIESLKGIYGNKVISIGIHAGFFAVPNNPPNPKFNTDFRTAEGTELDNTFGNSAAGLPNGMVNRKEVTGSKILTYQNWGTVLGQIINTPPDVRIKLSTTYDNGSRTAAVVVKTNILNDLNDTYRICAYVTEDSIVDWQKDYDITPDNDINTYTHRHVLRGSMNTAWGTPIGTGALLAGENYQDAFSMVLNNAWDADHCAVVVFIYNTNTGEVIQVEEAHIVH